MTRRDFGKAAAAGAFPAACLTLGCRRSADPAREPDPGIEWIRPAYVSADPVWGIRGRLAVGLWPTTGPRGLIRVYAPYLDQKPRRTVNFIAVEPVVGGIRGQSELEVGLTGGRSGRAGLTMWSGDTAADVVAQRDPSHPAPGRVERVDGTEALTVYLATEPFRNGARPVLQVVLRADRPHEVGFRVHAADGGARMDSCVLTATMGNYGRLRRLWLRGEVVDSRRAWPDPKLDKLGFTPWRAWDRDRLVRADGRLLVAATSDEADPAVVEYDAAVPAHWRYEGRPGTHYWRGPDAPGAVVRVNGRPTYWGGGGPIPGGTAFENFELEVPFADGQEFWFGVTPDGPAALGFDAAWERNLAGGA